MSDDDLWGEPSLSGLLRSTLPPNSRPRGLLTESDRKVLQGETEFSHQESFSRARSRIRERVINGILDFTVLDLCLQEADREEIFKSFDVMDFSSDHYGDHIHHSRALRNALSFIYQGVGDKSRFERILERGIQRAETPPDRVSVGNYEVNVDIDIKTPPTISVDALIEKVAQERLDNLTEAEMYLFIKLFTLSSEFDPESVADEYERRRSEILGPGADPSQPIDSDELLHELWDREFREDAETDNGA